MRLLALDTVLLVGLKGSGKTYFANEVLVPLHETVGIFDPNRNYRVTYYQDPEKIPSGAEKWAVQASCTRTKDFKAKFSAFAEACERLRPSLILVDETALLALPSFGCADMLAAMALNARNYGSATVFIAQRLFNIPVAIRSQGSQVITFQQCDLHDIACLVKITADPNLATPVEWLEPESGQKKMVPAVAALKQGQFFRRKIRVTES